MNTTVPIFCKVPLPDRVKNILDTMERDPCTDLVYVDADDTLDGYRSRMKSLARYEGFFIVYDRLVSKDGRDCLTWYIDGQDGSVVSDITTASYIFRDFFLGYSGVEDLQEYVDDEGIFVRPDTAF